MNIETQGFLSCGEIRAEISKNNGSASMRLLVDQNISDYYRSLIPKYKNAKPQKYKSHITIIRANREYIPKHLDDLFHEYNYKTFYFYYIPYIMECENYFWLDVYSHDLEKIRKQFGLGAKDKFKSQFDNFESIFHITIANKKRESPGKNLTTNNNVIRRM